MEPPGHSVSTGNTDAQARGEYLRRLPARELERYAPVTCSTARLALAGRPYKAGSPRGKARNRGPRPRSRRSEPHPVGLIDRSTIRARRRECPKSVASGVSLFAEAHF